MLAGSVRGRVRFLLDRRYEGARLGDRCRSHAEGRVHRRYPLPAAIRFPNGFIGVPEIRDAERLQGFEVDWTAPAVGGALRVGARWKLVGNAVSVPVARWVGGRLLDPQPYNGHSDAELPPDSPWPKAAWGDSGKVFRAELSAWPVRRRVPPVADSRSTESRTLSEPGYQGISSAGGGMTPQLRSGLPRRCSRPPRRRPGRGLRRIGLSSRRLRHTLRQWQSRPYNVARVPMVDHPLRQLLDELEPTPDVSADREDKHAYAMALSRKLAVFMARALRPAFPNVLPDRGRRRARIVNRKRRRVRSDLTSRCGTRRSASCCSSA